MKNSSLDSFIITLVNERSPYGTTLRHIFYEAVSAGFYPGTHDDYYNKIKPVVRRLREQEKLNEDFVLDGTRLRQAPYVFSNPGDFLFEIQDDYKKDLWEDQDIQVEIFSEKDAMSPLLSSIANKHRVHYNMVRGYSSDTLIYRVFKAWRELPEDKEIHVLYLGDHDPSGKDLERSVRQKIRSKLILGRKADYADEDYSKFDIDRIVWKRVAVKEADLDTYSGSLIPCKPKDTRTPDYLAKYGNRCLEVDAIDTAEIVSRLEKAILKRTDKALWDAAEVEEEKEQEKLKEAIEEISEHLTDL